MELKELIKYARDNRCSDLHITAGEAVAVRKYLEENADEWDEW